MADKLCAGSLVPLLSHLARAREFTEEQRRALRELVERGGSAPPRKPRVD